MTETALVQPHSAPSVDRGGGLRAIEQRHARFDPRALTVALDGRYAPIRNRMRALLSEPEFAYRYGLDRHEDREQVLEWTRRLAQEGIGRIALPAPYGDGNVGAFVSALGILGHHDLSLFTKAGVQFGLFAGAIARLGTQKTYLAAAASLELPGAFAMTETGHGSNVRDLETTATYDAVTDELIIATPHDRARKDYIGNAAAHGRLAVVFARLMIGSEDHGVHAVLVPLRDRRGRVAPGVHITDAGEKEGLNGVDNGRIWFDDVRVPRTALLDALSRIDHEGRFVSEIESSNRRFFTMIGTLVGGRISVGAVSVSVAKSALTIAVRYAHCRRQFGPDPGRERLLIDYPAHQRRLLPKLAATYAYHFALDALVEDFASLTDDSQAIEIRAAGLKAFATWHALDTVQAAREATGGQGYLTVNRVASMRSDADVFTTYEGDNTVLAQLVTKSLLTDFSEQFSRSVLVAAGRYALRRIAALTETVPFVPARRPRNVEDPDWQLGLLRGRELHQIDALAARIKKRVDSGISAFDAFTEVQDHVLAVARSHVERIVYEAFVAGVAEVQDPATADVLQRLRALFGADRILADLGWFQEHGRLSAKTATAVRKSVGSLAAGLAAESLDLVNAFAIPESVLAAPIAISSNNDTRKTAS